MTPTDEELRALMPPFPYHAKDWAPDFALAAMRAAYSAATAEVVPQEPTDARAKALERLLSYGYLEPVTAYNHADWKRDFTAARAAITGKDKP